MPHRHHHHHSQRTRRPSAVGSWLSDFWEGFLSVPEAMCPKCRNGRVEYYDPYFFGLWRTLSGRRRFKCRDCGFVWRRSRGETYLDRMGF